MLWNIDAKQRDMKRIDGSPNKNILKLLTKYKIRGKNQTQNNSGNLT